MDFFTTVDTFIYGRKSYEAMIAYWPELKDEFANVMNQTKKLVFSRTPENVIWNSQLIKDNAVEEIQKQKKQEGKDLVLFAGADLAETFIKNNLIDEYRLSMYKELKAKGVEFCIEPYENGELNEYEAAFFDDSGNWFRLTERRTTNRLNSLFRINR